MGLPATTFNNFSYVSRSFAVMEKRKERRRRVFKAAMIEFPGGACDHLSNCLGHGCSDGELMRGM